ncbi:hypothetical protein [Streptomyces virginiae]|uniref:hypothetical protein n=1 Tax=Streptomyces virginiae TaxID=1961 RepID=UPI00225B1B5A|nr:hypothetical protein [Streptomyces virginiae]MCX4714235.1 hypothetical protein [Streptomyces virginiae]MCX5271950.1 hypothetical protein [Streptomyces virginiae]
MLKSAPPGPFSDVVHEEYTVNGRGVTDHDLEISAYISLSYGGPDDDHLTANVTFCGAHPGVLPYVADLEAFGTESLLRLRRTGEPPWSVRAL